MDTSLLLVANVFTDDVLTMYTVYSVYYTHCENRIRSNDELNKVRCIFQKTQDSAMKMEKDFLHRRHRLLRIHRECKSIGGIRFFVALFLCMKCSPCASHIRIY